MRRFLLAIAFCSTAPSLVAATARLPVEGGGAIVVTLPAGWTSSLRPAANGEPATLELTSSAGRGATMFLTAFASADRELTSPKPMRAAVSMGVAQAKERAVQKELPIEELRVAGGTGFWFHATDREPGPGEYEELVNGAIPVGDVALDFTLLAHEKPPASTVAPFAILTSAKLEAAPVAAAAPFAHEVVPVRGQGWHVAFDGPPLQRRQQSDREGGYAFKANAGRFNLSLFVEPPGAKGDAHQNVFDFYWPQARRNPMIDAKTVVIRTTPKYVRVQYDIRAPFEGKTITARNVNYYFAFRGKWNDLHISLVEPATADDAIFATFDRTLDYAVDH